MEENAVESANKGSRRLKMATGNVADEEEPRKGSERDDDEVAEIVDICASP